MMDRYQYSPSVSAGFFVDRFPQPGILRATTRFAFRACLMSVFLCCSNVAVARPPGQGGAPPPETTPLALEYEDYYFRWGQNSCIGEDDELEWLATGSLGPGETFTFSPAVTGCSGHAAAISVTASWDGGTLALSSNVPDSDYSSWDADQAGRLIEAPTLGKSAQLCMFPFYSSEGRDYTVAITNVSQTVVTNIRLHGRHENDWPIFYYPRCLNADADGDGWNDSLEHTMGILVYPIGYIDGVFQPYILWGSNYLRGHAETPFPLDEIDSFPPDLNDDGVLNQEDFSILEGWLGAGNGIALEDISPNPGPNWFHENTLPWRRYDLDGDGIVGSEDWQILQQTANSGAMPPVIDLVSPTARTLEPLDGALVPRGEYVMIRGHVWDNAALSLVEYRVNGREVCAITDPVPNYGFDSPFHYCWWKVPKRRGAYDIEIHAYDGAGNSAGSEAIFVEAY